MFSMRHNFFFPVMMFSLDVSIYGNFLHPCGLALGISEKNGPELGV